MNISKVFILLVASFMLASCDSTSSSKTRSCTYQNEPVDCTFFDEREGDSTTVNQTTSGEEIKPSPNLDADHDIVNDTKSTILPYRTNDAYFVMPPSDFEDEISITNYKPSTGLDVCDQLPKYLKYSESIEDDQVKLAQARSVNNADLKSLAWLQDRLDDTDDSDFSGIEMIRRRISILKGAIERQDSNMKLISDKIKTYQMVHKAYENMLKQKAGTVDVSLTSGWDTDIQTLATGNPGIGFIRAPIKENTKVYLRVLGHERLPALNMVIGFQKALNISTSGEDYYIGKVPRSFTSQADVSFFSACLMTFNEQAEEYPEPKEIKIVLYYTDIK